jgi:hypothetical protein
MKPMQIVVFALAWATIGLCSSLMAQTAATPTQVFDLRKKCQALSEELGESLTHGAFWHQSVTSNYSVRTQHCYARFELTPADVMNTAPGKYEDNVYLYDAHTKEQLAWTKAKSFDKKFGKILDEYYDNDTDGFDVANEYIRNLMRPER